MACLLFLVCFFLLGVARSRATYEANINCYVKHLKSKGILESSYPELSIDEEIENCEDRIKNFQMEIHDKFALSVYKCTLNDLKSKQLMELVLLASVYEASLTLTKEEIKTKVAEIDKTISKSINEAIDNCETESMWGDMFDSIIMKSDSSSSEEDDFNENYYCIRKHVVDNNLIDTVKYNVILNPSNVDVSAVNCEKVLKKSSEILDVPVLKVFNYNIIIKSDQCAFEEYREQNFGQKFMRLQVLRTFDLSEEEIAVEKKKFLSALISLAQSLKKCE